MIGYGFTKELNIPYETLIRRISDELKKEGFGILTEINVREKFREKLGIDFPKYVILGACHPPSAYKAILAEENIGLMLPCNIIVYEKNGKTILSIIKPTVIMEMISNDELKPIASDVELKLKKVFDAIV